MPVTYASEELRQACEDSALAPDRRHLIYRVRCPMTDDLCHRQECEYNQCLSSEDDDKPDIYVAMFPGPGIPHAPFPVDDFRDAMTAISESILVLDEESIPEIRAQAEAMGLNDEQRTQIAELADGALIVVRFFRSQPDNQQCGTCRRYHIVVDDDCPRCTRVMNLDQE